MKIFGGNFGKFALVLVTALFVCGCGKGTAPEGSRDYIYYVNSAGTGLVKEDYEISGEGVKEQVDEVLGELRKKTDSLDFKSAYPENVRIRGWKLEESDLEIDFTESYNQMDSGEELLLRAATVYTLVQVGGVAYVKFTVEGEELCDEEGKEIGYMNRDMFVENTGSSLHSYQDGNIHLFFADEAGNRLVEEEVSVRYNSNMSVEKLIVEQLIKGPSTEGAYPTVSPKTKILGVSVRDGICYVNFDEEFLNACYHVSPEVMVYSVVNSLVEGGEMGQVQILINGKTDVSFQDSISLERPFSRNLEIMEEEEH